jgi:signal transduction histidine kinase
MPLLNAVFREAERMSRLIDDLLDVSRIANGTIALSLAPVQPDDLVSEAVAEFGPLAATKEIQLSARCATNLPSVHVDRQRIQQVFGNLLQNALRYTPAGGQVSIGATCAGDGVAFHVTDQGPGIDEDERPHLFEPFYRGRAARGTGTGLGLFIVRSIIDAHGGRIAVNSARGLGSTFTFVIRHV